MTKSQTYKHMLGQGGFRVKDKRPCSMLSDGNFRLLDFRKVEETMGVHINLHVATVHGNDVHSYREVLPFSIRRRNEKNHKFAMMAPLYLSCMSWPHCNGIDMPRVNIRGHSFNNIIMSFYDSSNNIVSMGLFLHL